MAEKKNQHEIQVEADRTLIQFDTYEEYVDYFIQAEDVRYLRYVDTARTIVTLGYKNTGVTLTENEFYRRRNAVRRVFQPKVRGIKLASVGLDIKEPVAKALAERELENRRGDLQTIIFIRIVRTYEISCYIDYNHRLETEDWKPIFMEKKMITPKKTDLCFYHWKTQKCRHNISKNYKMSQDDHLGIIIINRHDHKTIHTDPLKHPGQNTTKTRIYSSLYDQCELYDHIVRKKG